MVISVLTTSLMAAMPVMEPVSCFDRTPMAIPAPNSEVEDVRTPIDIHQRAQFLIRAGAVTQPKLVESPVRQNTIGREFPLSASGQTFVAEGIVYEHFTTGELPLGVCFQMFERNANGQSRFTAAYQANILCSTQRGSSSELTPSVPTVEAIAEPSTYGSPGSGFGGNDMRVMPASRCAQAMQVGSGNITVSISGVSSAPGALLVELLGDGEPQTRDLLVHERMIATQQPLVVKYRANTGGDLKVRVTHRVFGGESGDTVEVDIVEPVSCQHLPTSSLVLVLCAATLRRRRQLS